MCIVTEANSKHYNVLVSEDIPVVVAGKTLKRERKTQSSLLTIAILQAEMMQTQQLMLLSHHLRYVIYVSEKADEIDIETEVKTRYIRIIQGQGELYIFKIDNILQLRDFVLIIVDLCT